MCSNERYRKLAIHTKIMLFSICGGKYHYHYTELYTRAHFFIYNIIVGVNGNQTHRYCCS